MMSFHSQILKSCYNKIRCDHKGLPVGKKQERSRRDAFVCTFAPRLVHQTSIKLLPRLYLDGSFILAARTRTDEVQFDLRDGCDGAGRGALGGGCAGLHHVERLFGDAAHLGRGSGPAIGSSVRLIQVAPIASGRTGLD